MRSSGSAITALGIFLTWIWTRLATSEHPFNSICLPLQTNSQICIPFSQLREALKNNSLIACSSFSSLFLDSQDWLDLNYPHLVFRLSLKNKLGLLTDFVLLKISQLFWLPCYDLSLANRCCAYCIYTWINPCLNCWST